MNFLCISYFNENIDWLKEYNNPHIIYNKVWETETISDNLDNNQKSKKHILKYEKTFYQNLKLFPSHSKIPGEANMLERALYTLWNCNFEVADTMKNPISFSIKEHKEFGFKKKTILEKAKSFIRNLK